MSVLSTQMDADTAKTVAEHIALEHSGMNAAGNSRSEINENKSMANDSSSITDEALGVVRVLSDDVNEVELANVEVKLPFKTVPNIRAKTVEEEEVKLHQAELRSFLRNKITKEEINSGLKTFKAKDGYSMRQKVQQE